ncbi:hypothetical protein Vretifemale_12294, partial [Volvox reticuliferus]
RPLLAGLAAPVGQGSKVALDDGGDEHHHLHGDGQVLGADGSGANDGVGGGAAGSGDGEGDPEQEAPALEGPVTETITAGFIGIHQRRAAIEQQVCWLLSGDLVYPLQQALKAKYGNTDDSSYE